MTPPRRPHGPGQDATGAVNGGDGQGVRYGVLTFALLGGAVLWLVRLVANVALVSTACEVGSTWPLWLTSAVAALLAGAALALSWRYVRSADADADTVRWLGLLGVAFNVLAIAGIVLETLPVAVLDVCRAVEG